MVIIISQILAKHLETVWIELISCASAFSTFSSSSSFFYFFIFLFFYFLCTGLAVRKQSHCSRTIHETHNHFIQKKILNESHGTIYTFKNYFTTVFLVFSKINYR